MASIADIKIRVVDGVPDDMVALVAPNSGVMHTGGQMVKFAWDGLRWTGEKIEVINMRIVEIDGQPVESNDE